MVCKVIGLGYKTMKVLVNYCGTLLLRGISNILNVFPIRKNRILFYSFNGKKYACNPYYISEYLEKHYGENLEMIWSFKNPDEFANCVPSSCKIVKFRSLKHYFYAKTSNVIIYNVQEQGELSKRKGQLFVQTWHASNGYKNISHPKDALDQKRLALMHKNYSIVLSGCESMSQRRVRTSMHFKGEIIHGTPRMDVLINQERPELMAKVRAYFGIDDDAKTVLYAPTWKKDRSDSDYGLDYERLKESLESRFGGSWIILVRFHPNMKVSDAFENEYIKNATNYPDIQELMYVADAMISDYSSCIWDYSFLDRPGFLFCTDFEENGGNQHFEVPIEEWGFPVCFSMDELTEAIEHFDDELNKQRIMKNHKTMGSYEDGCATERICSRIMEHINQKG